MSPQHSPQNQGQNAGASRRPPDIEDYIDMVRRYRSWIVGPMFAGLVIAATIAFIWPDTFVSTATIRVVPQQVASNILAPPSSAQISEQLISMRTDILSRQSLTEIILKPTLDLYPKERAKLPMEDVILEMRNKIQISPFERGSGGSRVAAFQISFPYTDRYKAQQVVRELADRFITGKVKYQQARTQSTSTFLADELKSAKDKMDDLDQKLTKFKIQNAGHLPEQTQANVNAQANLQVQLMNVGQLLTQAQSDRTLIETSLKNLQNKQRSAQANLEQSVTSNSSASVVRNEALINLDKLISEQRSALASMKKRFGNNHPDVAAQASAVDELERQRLTIYERQDPVTTTVTPPTVRTEINQEAKKTLDDVKSDIEMGQAQLATKQARIDELGRQQELLNARLTAYQKRLEEEPASSQQYAALQRDFALAKADYEDMAKKVDTAETAHSLETHNVGEQLELLDSATLPMVASEPNRWVWTAVGVFGGLGLGLVLAAAKEVKDTSLKNLKDVRAYTNLPILSSIPLLENALLVRRKRRLVWLVWSSCLIVGVLVMSTSIYYHFSTI